ncbi:hypothetical protein M0811_13337 [Anaeramoeba ignava]|uniref:TLDc domain-containing protein n=1 Tax=Anaeramoeba ignava TaxID=1746090 RepID=A0A9Q0L751_ANAIG|nr:hypothetical protein M0811_13337 [Anaeramoeba ignava]
MDNNNNNQTEIVEIYKKENQDLKKEIEDLKREIEKMKPVFDKYREQYQKDLEYQKQIKELRKPFSNSEIIQDIEYIQTLKEWINDNDFFSKMNLGFSAKKDGFSAQNWHKAVDNKGKTLVIIKTKDNFIFGGFTQVGWQGKKGYISDSNAFIFSLRNDKGDRNPQKFTIKYGKEQYAIVDDSENGPIFGYSWRDWNLKSNLQPGYSNFGESYNLPKGIKYGTDLAQTYLSGSYTSSVVVELETYFI